MNGGKLRGLLPSLVNRFEVSRRRVARGFMSCQPWPRFAADDCASGSPLYHQNIRCKGNGLTLNRRLWIAEPSTATLSSDS